MGWSDANWLLRTVIPYASAARRERWSARLWIRTCDPVASLACFSISESTYARNLELLSTRLPASPMTTILPTRTNPVQPSFLVQAITTSCCRHSKGLPESEVKLAGSHSGNRVQVLPYVKPNRTYWSLVPEPDTYRVRVILDEVADVDRAVDI